MARPGRKKGTPKTGGRKPGTPNKLTVAAKEAFQLAFEGVGGVDGLIKWAQHNPDEFYKLYARLIPVDVKHGGSIDFKGLSAVYGHEHLQPTAEDQAARH